MIDKREIIDTAAALGLTPHVVEKDYVLGWLMRGRPQPCCSMSLARSARSRE